MASNFNLDGRFNHMKNSQPTNGTHIPNCCDIILRYIHLIGIQTDWKYLLSIFSTSSNLE